MTAIIKEAVTVFLENRSNPKRTIYPHGDAVHRNSEHRIVTPQSKSAAFRRADYTQGNIP